MEDREKTSRSRFRFSLRTLFAMILLVAVALGFYAYWRRSNAIGLDGYSPVSLIRLHKWQSGDPHIQSFYEGRIYRLANKVEQEALEATPEKYAPVCSGNDLVRLIDENRRIAGERQFGIEYRNRIYLFDSAQSQRTFAADPTRYITAQAALRDERK
jgi:YHS domain-containing protein